MRGSGKKLVHEDLQDGLKSLVVTRVVEVVAELLRAAGRAELLQGLGFNLAYALTRDRETAPNLLKRAGHSVVKPIPHPQDVRLALRQLGAQQLRKVLAHEGSLEHGLRLRL
mmetsp:Transcript_27739/g.84667  ORF Transcript_27739/g.84667 Transcript_27739/m.84667 type:complete len:112 (-) Transcript_27739:1234-1569(-)|eukprot:scaffold37481_cov30-Tisochrysis_lutea.AAC.2